MGPAISPIISMISGSDGARTHARYPVWKGIIPLPPDSLIRRAGAESLEQFLVEGDAWAQLVSKHVPEDAAVLEAGCGCGQIARTLVHNRHIRTYAGFDMIPDNVAWCNCFIKPLWLSQAFFYCFDIEPHELVFPGSAGSADVVFAASLFTHLLEPDAQRCLSEVRRVLAPDGRALIGIHTQVAPGIKFEGTETGINIEIDYFREMAARAELREIGYVDDLVGRQVFVFTPA